MNPHPRPEPFSVYTTPEFWNDPHISASMLVFHLDPDSPYSSRTGEFMDRSVDWLIPTLELRPGSRVLDLGCGPGLYATRLARRGIEVLGVDVSQRSLEYARDIARRDSLPAAFVEGNYLTADLGTDHDAAILIYEDYCALSPAQRATLLPRVHDALTPGGRLLLDVTSAARFADFAEGSSRVPNFMDGFWADPPYVGVQETWTYPELRLALEKYTIETDAWTREFWNWTHCLTPDEVTAELADAGFQVVGVFGDVAGADHDPESGTFAVVGQRA